jgi:hypothetical protein
MKLYRDRGKMFDVDVVDLCCLLRVVMQCHAEPASAHKNPL